MKSRLRSLIGIITVYCILLCGCSASDRDASTEALSSRTEMQSSYEYKLYREHTDYRKALRNRMKSAYINLAAYIVDARISPVPGIIETYTVDGSENNISEQYVPQGLCRAERYWLITAYDGQKKNNSVVYVVDTFYENLISTLTLPGRYHAGGIAFDGERIWLTGDTSDGYTGEPFVQYVDYEAFKEMISNPLYEISRRELSDRIYIRNKPSFLEYNNGTLWVGTYAGSKSTSEGYMNGYAIIQDEEGNASLNNMIYQVITGIDSSAQGADIYGSDLYVSSSYNGSLPFVKTSFVTRYDISALGSNRTELYLEGKEISRVEVPKMNEEIIVENGLVYVNFESAAENWKTAVIRTDRILAFRQSLWE